MRGKYNLRDWEINYWVPKVKKDIELLMHSTEMDEIDYTDRDLNPYQMRLILEGLGWEEDDVDMNGWEQDRWAFYIHPDYEDGLCISSCGITFGMKLQLHVRD